MAWLKCIKLSDLNLFSYIEIFINSNWSPLFQHMTYHIFSSIHAEHILAQSSNIIKLSLIYEIITYTGLTFLRSAIVQSLARLKKLNTKIEEDKLQKKNL